MKSEIFYKSEAITDGTQAQTTTGWDCILFTVKGTGATVQDSDDGTTFAAADTQYVIKDTESATEAYKIAYIGYKKYVKVTGSSLKVGGIKYNSVHQG